MKTYITFRFLLIILLIFSSIHLSGQVKNETIINSPPPRADYNPVELKSAQGNWVYLDVPSYKWSYGCTVTAAAMLAGYYDRHGFWCIYNGEKNGGAAPRNNNWSANNLPVPGNPNAYYPNWDNSIAASKNGVDGRTTDGHVDDFWNRYEESSSTGFPDPDPWSGNTPPHDFDLDMKPCVADYMGSSQDYFNISDGSTRIFTNDDNSKLHDRCRKTCFGSFCWSHSNRYWV